MTASSQPYLEIKNLSKSFQEGDQTRRVLQDCSLQIRQGEFTAVVGRSGSGKSTLLNLISGIDQPDSGRILLEGKELTGMTERERTLFRRSQIGFVFQFFNLIPTLTVGENISLPLELTGLGSEAALPRVRQLLEEVGLGDRIDTFPDRLSGGEQQRVAIARALVHDPSLVLADEPTGNLDQATGIKVLQLLVRLTKQVGKNLILVTHSLDNVTEADRIVELQAGCFQPIS